MHQERIIFMGTPNISRVYLQSLIDNKYNVVATYTQPPRKQDRGMKIKNSPVHILASENNIPVYTPKNFIIYENINQFTKLNPDVVIVMGYGILLPKKLLKIPVYGFINIHLSLLPRWKGAAPIEYAILNGDNKTGVSIFQLEEKLDSGPIIASKAIDLDNKITKKDLMHQLNRIGSQLIINILPDYLDKKILLKKQDHTKSTYAKKITSTLRKINFYDTTNNIFNQVRAFSPKPSAWFMYKNDRINIIQCSTRICKVKPSYILNEKFHLGCKDGIIIPEIIQRDGKKPIKISDFLRGYTFKIGQKING